VVTSKGKNMFNITIKENEKALLYKDEKLIDLLSVGKHKIFNLFQNYTVERYRVDDNGIEGEKASTLLKLYPELVNKFFTTVELKDYERAFITINGKLTEFLNLGATKLYWRELDTQVEKVNVQQDYHVSKEHKELFTLLNSTPIGVIKHLVSSHQNSYLYLDGDFEKELDAGQHYFYMDLKELSIKDVDTRIKELEITGQELLSSDKVTLRCNLTMHYKVTDGRTFLEEVEYPKEYLYKQLQFAIREYLGAINIDEILSKQHTLSDEILNKFYDICQKIGVTVEGVYIKDIILPGEMREIFNQVIEASKRAEANNIQRREETSATRSLLNTAKLMRDNPALARLKELEALEKITKTVGTLNVYGGLNEVMHGLVDLKGE
jgi:regulator of protease activity HflC (stomatin/prohibitin superfamily)